MNNLKINLHETKHLDLDVDLREFYDMVSGENFTYNSRKYGIIRLDVHKSLSHGIEVDMDVIEYE